MLVLTHPSVLTEDDKALAKILRERCPELNRTARLAEAFAVMLVNLTGNADLESWVAAAEASEIRELAGFAAGPRRDWSAALAGLTLHWNSGPVEGHAN